MHSRKRPARQTPSPDHQKKKLRRVSHDSIASTAASADDLLNLSRGTPHLMKHRHRDCESSPWAMSAGQTRSRSAYAARNSVMRTGTVRSSALMDVVPFMLPLMSQALVEARLSMVIWMSRTVEGISPRLEPSTFYVAVDILDRYLLAELRDGRSAAQLINKIEVIGFACLYLGSKLEDSQPLDLDDILRSVASKRYPIQKASIVTEERKVLNKLGWDISSSIMSSFSSSGPSDILSKIVAEACLFNALYLSIDAELLTNAIDHVVRSVHRGEDFVNDFLGPKEAVHFAAAIFLYVIYRYSRRKQRETTSRPSTSNSCTSVSTHGTERTKKTCQSSLSFIVERHKDMLEQLVDPKSGKYGEWYDAQTSITEFGGMTLLRDHVRTNASVDVFNLKRQTG